ncbi:uncharacterized protein LOC143292552 isoform X2 [Babylonia areolata]|uniref:uncharacterized protein LOC143292552 isoform X2 n=1 Tax=Babylonia areolata TaxID=304850 RepID=UPI003FD5FEF8
MVTCIHSPHVCRAEQKKRKRNFLLRGTVAAAGEIRGQQQQQCDGYRLYFDHGTEHCELCSEICGQDEGAIRGTEDQCKEECPRYIRALRCEEDKGRYYDEMHDTCEYCCDLCRDHTDPSPLCQQKCPGLSPLPNPSPPGPHDDTENRRNLPPCARIHGTDNSSITSFSSPHTVAIIVAVVIAAPVIGIIVVLLGYAILKTSDRRYEVVRQRDATGKEEGGGRGGTAAENHPVEETETAPPFNLVVVTVDGVWESSTTVETGFADLSVGHVGRSQFSRAE